jgi:hypothetical protein
VLFSAGLLSGAGLLQRGSRTPEELLSGASFQQSSESGEDCSSGVLELCSSNLLCRKKTVLPHVVSFDEVALQKILRLGVIQC